MRSGARKHKTPEGRSAWESVGDRRLLPALIPRENCSTFCEFPGKVIVKYFRTFDLHQRLLLPPDLQDWLPEGHLARFVAEIMGELDLSGILAGYARDGRGKAAYHPQMMTGLLIYGYCTGIFSWRRIERATFEDVGFRFLSGDQHPDHDSIAAFRERHLDALKDLFLHVLQLCEEAGLVKLGHVAPDGTKVKANASKHKAMSYDHLCKRELELAEKIAGLLAQAASIDAAEDQQYGSGKSAEQLPAELARSPQRVAKIREAKAALEQAAHAVGFWFQPGTAVCVGTCTQLV